MKNIKSTFCLLPLSLLLALAWHPAQAHSGIAGLTIDTVVPRIDVGSNRLPASQTILQSLQNMLKLNASDWRWTAQDALGTLRIANGSGGKIAALPVGTLLTDPTRPDGYQCYADVCQIVASNVITTFNAALDDPQGFMDALRQLDPAATAHLNGEGNLQVTVNGRRYVAQVGWNILAATAANGFNTENGALWFTGATGKQALTPVLANFDRLTAIAKKIDPSATAVGDHQGRVTLVFFGKTYRLAPNWEVVATPAAHASDDYWVDSGVLYLNYLDGTAQGLMVR